MEFLSIEIRSLINGPFVNEFTVGRALGIEYFLAVCVGETWRYCCAIRLVRHKNDDDEEVISVAISHCKVGLVNTLLKYVND